MNWTARGNVLNQYLRNTSIGTTVRLRGIFNISRLCVWLPFYNFIISINLLYTN